MRLAFFPGTFNPPTIGHLDIIKKSLCICDQLIIGIARNKAKATSIFSEEERVSFLKEMTKDLERVEVTVFSGLVADFVHQRKVDFIIRGLRSPADFNYEAPYAIENRRMCGAETLFLLPESQNAHISSSLVREIGSFGHSLKGLVPEVIEPWVYKKLTHHD